MEQYTEPLALIVISSISIGLAGLVALWIAIDIILRRGWRSMMGIMIPVYILNALYLAPLTLWIYLKYGRPSTPGSRAQKACHSNAKHSEEKQYDTAGENKGENPEDVAHCNDGHHQTSSTSNQDRKAGRSTNSSHQGHCSMADNIEAGHSHHNTHQHHASERPIFATVTVAVCHCGAGCVLGDIIGEWIVYGSGAMLGQPPRMIWVEWLVDFAFAIAIGIVFQYFSIAPMSGDYSLRTVIRAAKADVLSLLFFEIGLFGWMAAFQIGIFKDMLPMNTVTYWWMMQIGMFIGHWTGVPINWWLIKKGVKEPCA